VWAIGYKRVGSLGGGVINVLAKVQKI